MTTAFEFDLRELARQVTAQTPSCEIDVLVKEVSHRTADEHLRVAYEQALSAFLVRFITRERGAGYGDLNDPEAVVIPEQRGDPDRAPALGRSWKGEGIRRYGRMLKENYSTTFGPHNRKPLGEFTADDCLSAAVMRERLAQGNIAAASHLRELRDILLAREAAAVHELPAPLGYPIVAALLKVTP